MMPSSVSGHQTNHHHHHAGDGIRVMTWEEWWNHYHSYHHHRHHDDDGMSTTAGTNRRAQRREHAVRLWLDTRLHPFKGQDANLKMTMPHADSESQRQQQQQQQDHAAKTNHHHTVEEKLKDIVVHIPWIELKARSFELPPRPAPDWIVRSHNINNNINNSNKNNQHGYWWWYVLVPDEIEALNVVLHVLQGQVKENFPDLMASSLQAPQHVVKRSPARKTKKTKIKVVTFWVGVTVLLVPSDDKTNKAVEHQLKQQSSIMDQLISPSLPMVPCRFKDFPQPRLWQPNSMVETILLPLLKEQLARFVVEHANSIFPAIATSTPASAAPDSCTPSTIMEIWDLGAGAGRDVAFVAEELQSYCDKNIHWCRPEATSSQPIDYCSTTYPFCVVGWDQRYRCSGRPSSSDTATVSNNDSSSSNNNNNNNHQNHATAQFWHRRGVAAVTAARCIDLMKQSDELLQELVRQDNLGNNPDRHDIIDSTRSVSVATSLQKQQVMMITSTIPMCVYAVRCWHRPFFEALATTWADQLPPGFVVAVSHFGKPHDNAPWSFRHPKEAHVLERRELSILFGGSSRWRILYDNVTLDGDLGRSMIHFVAQRHGS